MTTSKTREMSSLHLIVSSLLSVHTYSDFSSEPAASKSSQKERKPGRRKTSLSYCIVYGEKCLWLPHSGVKAVAVYL